MAKTFSTAKTKADDGKKWEDDLPFEMVDIRQLAKGEYRPIRLVGFIEPFMRFWVPTEADKAYDPYKTKCKMYPAICSDFDSAEEVFSGNDCLYRKAQYQFVDKDSGEKKWGKLKPTKNYLIFFIDRENQEEREGIPLKKKFNQPLKFSDIKCATVPTAFAREVQNAIEMFTKKNKQEVDPTDPVKGFDLFFKFDSSAAAEAKYNIMLGDQIPLTKAELKQIELIPESVNIYPKDSPQKIADSLERHGYVIVERGEDPDEVKAAGSSKKASKSTMKAGAEMMDDDDEEDEEGTPSKSKASVKKESFDDEEDDLGLDDDDDGDDEDDADDAEAEDDEEAPKKSKKAKKAKKAPVKDDDDDDDDEDGFDFDDDDFE